MQDAALTLAGETVYLAPERAAWWPRAATLIVADLHWGKSEALQQGGIPLASGALADDLGRLSNVARRYGAKRIIILGDLVHAPKALTAAVVQEVAEWRKGMDSCEMVLLKGNHDRHLQLPFEWGITEWVGDPCEGPFCFTHSGRDEANSFVRPVAGATAGVGKFYWAGHIHPAITLRARFDRVRVPCFVVSADGIWLPAFGSLTGAVDVKPQSHEQVYAIAGRTVMKVEFRS